MPMSKEIIQVPYIRPKREDYCRDILYLRNLLERVGGCETEECISCDGIYLKGSECTILCQGCDLPICDDCQFNATPFNADDKDFELWCEPCYKYKYLRDKSPEY